MATYLVLYNNGTRYEIIDPLRPSKLGLTPEERARNKERAMRTGGMNSAIFKLDKEIDVR